MRAVRVMGDGAVGTVEVQPPAGEGVRVRVTACGICGSDHHLVEMGVPVTLGHEITGVLADGTPVVIEPYAACGSCDRCLAGLTTHCRAMGAMYGITSDGGLADEILVDPSSVIPLPSAMPPRLSALAEPLAVGIHGLNRVELAVGSRVLVVGAGPIGLLVAAAAVDRGAVVDLAARYDHQRVAAEAIGASPDVGRNYELVIDAVGTQATVDQAIGKARPGGTVLVVATFWEPVQIGLGFGAREVRLVPAFAYGRHRGQREFADAIDLLARRPELGDHVVSHEVSLDDAAEAFRIAADRSAGARKVLVVP